MTSKRKLTSVLLVEGVLFAGIALQAQQSQGESGSAAAQAEPTVAPQPTRVRLSMGASMGLLRKKVAPEYPPVARANHVQGKVLVNAVISKAGDVLEVTVISGDPSFAHAAIKAVKKWEYKPYLVEGQATEFETIVELVFRLVG